MRSLIASLRLNAVVQEMAGKLDQCIRETAIESSIVTLAVGLRQRLERDSQDCATLSIEDSTDPHPAALTRAQSQRPLNDPLRLLRRITFGINGVSLVVAEDAEPTNAEFPRLLDQRCLIELQVPT